MLKMLISTIREKTTRALVVGFACNDAQRCGDKLANALEYRFGIRFVAEVFYQFFV